MITIDPSRIDGLRSICRREQAVLSEANAEANSLTSALALNRKETLNLQRTSSGVTHLKLVRLEREKDDMEKRLAVVSEEVTIRRERWSAANKLRTSCEEWLTKSASVGGAQ